MKRLRSDRIGPRRSGAGAGHAPGTDRIRILPGDLIPADRVVVSGEGSVNQASITGESLPADKTPGDEVYAGSENLNGRLEVQVSRSSSVCV